MYNICVGTAVAASECSSQLGMYPSVCLADDGGVAGDTLRLEKGMKTMWNPPAMEIMMGNKNDENSLKILGEA